MESLAHVKETQTRVFDVSEGCTPMTSQFLTWLSFNMSKGSKICEVLCVTVFAEEERGKEWPKSMSNNKEEFSPMCGGGTFFFWNLLVCE